MARDSILDDAATDDQTNSDDNASETDQTDNADRKTESGSESSGPSAERVKLTQRVPPELLADIERVQEEFMLPSRNATINFMLKQAAEDL